MPASALAEYISGHESMFEGPVTRSPRFASGSGLTCPSPDAAELMPLWPRWFELSLKVAQALNPRSGRKDFPLWVHQWCSFQSRDNGKRTNLAIAKITIAKRIPMGTRQSSANKIAGPPSELQSTLHAQQSLNSAAILYSRSLILAMESGEALESDYPRVRVQSIAPQRPFCSLHTPAGCVTALRPQTFCRIEGHLTPRGSEDDRSVAQKDAGCATIAAQPAGVSGTRLLPPRSPPEGESRYSKNLSPPTSDPTQFSSQ